MGMVMTITRHWTVLSKLKHYLFECPTFWRRKPAFQCPHCGKKYRCYWDGNDCGGKINVCHECAEKYERLGAWNETSNDRVEGRDAALSRRVPSHDGLGQEVAGK